MRTAALLAAGPPAYPYGSTLTAAACAAPVSTPPDIVTLYRSRVERAADVVEGPGCLGSTRSSGRSSCKTPKCGGELVEMIRRVQPNLDSETVAGAIAAVRPEAL